MQSPGCCDDYPQRSEGPADQCATIRARGTSDRSCAGATPALFVVFPDRRLGKQLCAAGRHGLVNESVYQTGTDQSGQGGFCIAIAGDDHDEIRKLAFDLADKDSGCLMQGLHIQDQDADFARHQEIAYLVGRRHVP